MIYVDPPAGVNMSSASIEAAVRRQTLDISGRSNIVIRGMVFRHAADCVNTAGVSGQRKHQHSLRLRSRRLWNNWGGIGIYGTNNVTVQNSVSNYNGGVGFMGANDP